MEMNIEKSLEQLAQAITAKAAAAAPPASRQVQDPTRARTGSTAGSKTLQRDASGRLTGYTETKDDGSRVEQVFHRDAQGRISKIVSMPAGSMVRAMTKARGGFLPPALPEPEYSWMMKAMHAEAWTAFVRKHRGGR